MAQETEAAVAVLRDEYRIKVNVDYAFTTKYGDVRVLCNKVYSSTIDNVFKDHGIVVKAWYFY
jgi:hypothetical protein